MIRLVRFAVKLGFTVNPDCEKPIFELAELLANIPAARLQDEALKLFLSGYAVQTYEMLRHYGLFQYLYPAAEQSLSSEDNGFPKMFTNLPTLYPLPLFLHVKPENHKPL
jgi:poly(A) polymerase